MSVSIADGDEGGALVVLGVDRHDVRRRESVDCGDHRGRNQPRVGEGQEVEAVVDHVELRCPLEHLRNMQALGDLRIDAWVFRPAPRDHTAEASRCLRVPGREERHIVASGDEPFGQERSKEFPRSVVPRGNTPRNRCEDRNAHASLQRPSPGRAAFLSRSSRFSFFAPLFSLRDFPGFFPEGFWGDLSGMAFSNRWQLSLGSFGGGTESTKKVVQRYGRHADRGIAHSVGNDEGARVEERTAGVDDIRYVTVLLITVRGEERFAQSADDSSGVFEVEQDRPDVVGTKRTDAVGEHQPTLFSLNGRPAVAELNDFPWCRRVLARQRLFPAVGVPRIGDRVRFPIRSRQGREPSVDQAGKESETLVGCCAAGHRRRGEVYKILCRRATVGRCPCRCRPCRRRST